MRIVFDEIPSAYLAWMKDKMAEYRLVESQATNEVRKLVRWAIFYTLRDERRFRTDHNIMHGCALFRACSHAWYYDTRPPVRRPLRLT